MSSQEIFLRILEQQNQNLSKSVRMPEQPLPEP
eukprot:COSAG02_NODE_53747_length_298_cov_0.527363_1_plen_32_part_10